MHIPRGTGGETGANLPLGDAAFHLLEKRFVHVLSPVCRAKPGILSYYTVFYSFPLVKRQSIVLIYKIRNNNQGNGRLSRLPTGGKRKE
jgi:hypothetical protein